MLVSDVVSILNDIADREPDAVVDIDDKGQTIVVPGRARRSTPEAPPTLDLGETPSPPPTS